MDFWSVSSGPFDHHWGGVGAGLLTKLGTMSERETLGDGLGPWRHLALVESDLSPRAGNGYRKASDQGDGRYTHAGGGVSN